MMQPETNNAPLRLSQATLGHLQARLGRRTPCGFAQPPWPRGPRSNGPHYS